MKVAHLTTVDLTLRFLLLPQLTAVRDLDGDSIGISAPGPWVAELEEAGIRHLPLESSTRGVDVFADLRAMRELWAILRSERPDILHTHNPKPGLYGRILGRIAGVPTIVNTVHGLYVDPDDPLSKRLFVYALEAIASRFSDAELVQSREDFDLMRRWRISPRRHTKWLGNGVNLDRFDPVRFSDDREAIRAELGVHRDQIVIGIVGRLVVEKGFLELFAAADQLDNRFRVVCVGPDDPEKRDAIPREAIVNAERNGVTFLGMRTDVDRFYAAMDIFALPTHREGFPRAAMEASAMGLPVVASNVRGCREVVDDGESGYLVPAGDPLNLALAIERLGDDPGLRLRLGRNARIKALAEFDERDVVSRVIDCYKELTPRLADHGHS